MSNAETEFEGLSNLDYRQRYETILTENLPSNFKQFGEFFGGIERLKTLGKILSKHSRDTPRKILNVGSGPFATEIFLDALQDQETLSFDYTPEFEPFFKLFQADGHLSKTTFQQLDATTAEFEAASFDLIIIHDVFYETALELEPLISRYAHFLKPGGEIMFDFVNTRTRWIWKILGRPDQFQRYDPRSVKQFLDHQKLEVLEFLPTNGATKWHVKLVHNILWNLFRASNNYAVFARKSGQ